ncbi:hypothetical protein MWH25_08115 [Natroniella acetigena]|uniref:hypothetical protein n=1 Tax=Natroniella acetigena TaxID=52004 RepID=UPI00200AD19E|nr:hypothetical protein [Natroniella acetigena]MCK8827707.1 hypothetical protein [Natroniella acetigena]
MFYDHDQELNWIVIVNDDVHGFELKEDAQEFYELSKEKADSCDLIQIYCKASEGDEMPEAHKLKLTDEQLLALREVIGHVDDHENWMVDVMEHGQHLEDVYRKVYKLAEPVVKKIREER